MMMAGSLNYCDCLFCYPDKQSIDCNPSRWDNGKTIQKCENNSENHFLKRIQQCGWCVFVCLFVHPSHSINYRFREVYVYHFMMFWSECTPDFAIIIISTSVHRTSHASVTSRVTLRVLIIYVHTQTRKRRAPTIPAFPRS
jgi:hypothetical protein